MLEPVAGAWTDLVVHVLAHLPSTAPASLFDARYVAYVAERLGGDATRELDEALEPLRAIAGEHARYAALQGLAFLFETPAEAGRFVRRDLREISGHEVAEPALLALLGRVEPEAEILRSIVELEAERHARLPATGGDEPTLRRELAVVEAAAPELARHRVHSVRSLRLRGRVHGERIWVGAPSAELDISAEHVAWQAAHEATVGELASFGAGPAFDDRPLEQAALVLLRERARRVGLAAEHARWLAHLTGLPPLDGDRLLEPYRAEVAARLGSG